MDTSFVAQIFGVWTPYFRVYVWVATFVTFMCLWGLPGRSGKPFALSGLGGSLVAAIFGFVLWPFALAAFGVTFNWWRQPRYWFR